MIRRVQPNVFDVQDELMNMPVDCAALDGIDLEHWREKGVDGRGIMLSMAFDANCFCQPFAK
jgi:hypothetical protein